MEEVKFKGLTLVHLHEFLLEQFGEEGIQRVQSRLSPLSAEAFLAPSGQAWYPLAMDAEIEAAAIDELYGGDYSQAARWGRYDARRQVGWLYRYLFRMLRPAQVLDKAATLWKGTMSHGTCEVVPAGPREVLVTLSGYDQLHRVLCYNWQGSFLGVLEACGVRGQVVHEACRFDGAPACAYRLSWS